MDSLNSKATTSKAALEFLGKQLEPNGATPANLKDVERYTADEKDFSSRLEVNTALLGRSADKQDPHLKLKKKRKKNNATSKTIDNKAESLSVQSTNKTTTIIAQEIKSKLNTERTSRKTFTCNIGSESTEIIQNSYTAGIYITKMSSKNKALLYEIRSLAKELSYEQCEQYEQKINIEINRSQNKPNKKELELDSLKSLLMYIKYLEYSKLSYTVEDTKNKELIIKQFLDQKDAVGDFDLVKQNIHEKILSSDISTLNIKNIISLLEKVTKKQYYRMHEHSTDINIFKIIPRILQPFIDMLNIEYMYTLTDKGLTLKEESDRDAQNTLHEEITKTLRQYCYHFIIHNEEKYIKDILSVATNFAKNIHKNDYRQFALIILNGAQEAINDFHTFHWKHAQDKDFSVAKKEFMQLFRKYDVELEDYDNFLKCFFDEKIFIILHMKNFQLTTDFMYFIACNYTLTRTRNTSTHSSISNIDDAEVSDLSEQDFELDKDLLPPCSAKKITASPERNFIKSQLTKVANYNSTDEIDTKKIPSFIKEMLTKLSHDFCLPSAFGFFGPKNIELAKTYANYMQSDKPYYGTFLQFLIMLSSNATTEEILSVAYTFLDIAASPEQSPYALNSLFAFAQIISYAIEQNPQIDPNLEKELADTAERVFLYIGECGIAEAYVMASKMLELKAKNCVYNYDFEQAIDLYKKTIKYLKYVNTDKEDLEYETRAKIEELNSEIDIINYLKMNIKTENTSNSVKQEPKNSLKDSSVTESSAESSEQLEDISDHSFDMWQQTFRSKNTLSKYQKKASQINFQKLFIKLNQQITGNFTYDFSILKKLVQNSYFDTLKTQIIEHITHEHKWRVLRIMQCMIYFHYLQCDSIVRLKQDTTKSLKLFFNDKKNISIQDSQNEAYLIAADLIELILNIKVPDDKRTDINYLKRLFLDINVSIISKSLKTIVASSCSTVAHMISIDDYMSGRFDEERESNELFEKANIINPRRLEKKLRQEEDKARKEEERREKPAS